MFSGKTEKLIRRLRAAEADCERVAGFKPSMDDRYPGPAIVSHSNQRFPCQKVNSAAEIPKRLEDRTQVVGIDEANFFDAKLVRVLREIASSGKRVIVAGLDLDYLGRPFVPMPELEAQAKLKTKTLAVCARCGASAPYTQRLVRSEELILVGAVDSYEARCRHCFAPELPPAIGEVPSERSETSALN